jgi:hypothetical protein
MMMVVTLMRNEENSASAIARVQRFRVQRFKGSRPHIIEFTRKLL